MHELIDTIQKQYKTSMSIATDALAVKYVKWVPYLTNAFI